MTKVKNFDTDPDEDRLDRLQRDRTFIIGGKQFTLRSGLAVGSTVLDAWRPMFAQMIAPDQPPVPDAEFARVFAEMMDELLVPSCVEAFREVCSPSAEDPVTLRDAVDLAVWAVGVVTARPTRAPQPSSPGSTAPTPEQDDTSSKDGSSSPADDPSPS